MKDLIFLGGPMGVGKTTVGRLLRDKLAPAFLLDGDWCWDMFPFDPNEENRRMVEGNIAHLLGAFLDNSGCEAVVFCWVMDRREIIESLRSRLAGKEYRFWSISLVASPGELERRVAEDIARGLRGLGSVERCLARLPLYDALDTIKIDTTGHTPEETAEEIAQIVRSASKE